MTHSLRISSIKDDGRVSSGIRNGADASFVKLTEAEKRSRANRRSRFLLGQAVRDETWTEEDYQHERQRLEVEIAERLAELDSKTERKAA